MGAAIVALCGTSGGVAPIGVGVGKAVEFATFTIGDPLLTSKVNVFVELAGATIVQLCEGVVSANSNLPALKLSSSVTVVLLVKSTVLKFAVASTALGTTPPAHFV